MLQINMLDPTRKWCTGCGDQPREAFTVHRGRADGLTDRCKACRKQARAQSYVANREKIRAKNDAWAAANADKKKAADKRYHEQNREKHLVAFRAYRAANREKLNQYDRAYYAANREARIATNRAWLARNPELRVEYQRRREERVRRATLHRFTDVQVEARFSVFGFRCVYCGVPSEQTDHVKPIALGGAHCLSNLRPVCRNCNKRKGASHHRDWLERLPARSPTPLPLP
jgi:5-methylcytosine-specific restriction endonuclease McrA